MAPNLAEADLAAMTTVARAILDMHETITGNLEMNPQYAGTPDMQRRTFLRYGLSGLGLLGLNSLMADQEGAHGAVNPLTFPPRPSASSSSTRRAGHRTWRRSTTSRSWRSCTARGCRRASPRGSRLRNCRASR